MSNTGVNLDIIEPLFLKHKGDFISVRDEALQLGVKLSKKDYNSYKKLLTEPISTPIKPAEPVQAELKLVDCSPLIQRHTEVQGRYVLTTAQSHTRVHPKFFATLINFCDSKGAKLLIARNGSLNDADYDPVVRPYLTSKRHHLLNDWHFCAELNGIKPSISDPIRGLETYTGLDCCVIPHVKTQLKSVPRRHGYKPKLVYTTGAITQPNYPVNKTGHVAHFHHTIGALYVELRNIGNSCKYNTFAYNLLADDDGSFYHLNTHYSPEDTRVGTRLLGIKWGDIHVEKLDPAVAKCSWGGSGSILEVLKPENQFVEDLCDFTARNHHIIHNRTRVTENYYNGHNSIADSLYACSSLLYKLLTGDGCRRIFGNASTKVFVTNANHNNAFVRWLENRDLSFIDPINEEIYFRYNALLLENIRKKQPFNVFQRAILDYTPLYNQDLLASVSFLDNKSFVGLEGVAMSDHGHLGANGACGSPSFYANLLEKNCIGHTHTHYTKNGSTGAGTSSLLDMGYNEGFSSWTHGHTGVYPNGKRVQLIINNGEW